MVDVHEVRQGLAEIESSGLPPALRAKQMLRLSKAVRSGVRRLAEGISILIADGMEEQAKRMNCVRKSLIDLAAEIRSKAKETLSEQTPASAQLAAFPSYLS